MAAELTPNQPRILNNIAVALEANGRFDEARTTYRAALALDPGNSRLRTNFERFEEFYASHVAPPEPADDGPEAAAADGGTPAGEGEE
jgi:Tfp pilus assembly protein PilF